jgi:uncharacterized membrane protein
MVSEEIRQLQERVSRLEREVQTLRPAPFTAAVPAAPMIPIPARPPESPRISVHPPIKREDEARVVGAWLARIGAVAVVVGAAFAFKYAIDRGLIGPGARVLLGLFAGMAFAVGAEWARRREWHGWAQAVAGGAVGLWYLSVWAAYQLYGLVDAPAALAGFSLITIAAVMLALRHESEPLALLAVGSGFANPFLVGVLRPVPVLAYILLIDLGVAALATGRDWRSLERVAVILTWSSLALTPDASLATSLIFGSAFFSLFTVIAMRRALSPAAEADPENGLFVVINTMAFSGFSLAHLSAHADAWLGTFCVVLGAIHVALAALVGRRDIETRNLLAVLASALFVLAVPLQLDGAVVPAIWTIQGVALLAAGRIFESKRLAAGGIGLVALAIADTLVVEIMFGSGYHPETLLFSSTSMLLGLEVAALIVGSRLVKGVDGLAKASGPLALAANLLGLTWATLEVRALVDHTSFFFDPGVQRNLAFATTATWATYAAICLAAGVALGSQLARYFGVGLLGVVVLKLVVSDLWLLDQLQRMIAFISLGAILLGLSLIYHRFRDLITEGRIR